MKLQLNRFMCFSSISPLTATVLFAALITITAIAIAAAPKHMVSCGIPQQQGQPLNFVPSGKFNGPWRDDPESGHLGITTFWRPLPDSHSTFETWMLSRSLGWWMLMSTGLHPDEITKIPSDHTDPKDDSNVQMIIKSPFLKEPVTVLIGDHDHISLVERHIFAIMPNAEDLLCEPSIP